MAAGMAVFGAAAARLGLRALARPRPRAFCQAGLAAPAARHVASSVVRLAEKAQATVVTSDVRAPANDPRQYRVLELANGLQVLLASDPTADSAAAALTVRCGTLQDPDHKLGLAHFHEHMLFLGTEKYPKEDEYNRFLGEHGGDSNAYTMSEYTTYHFKVASPHLPGALDRFAHFFKTPKFEPSCVEREMHAVDSESTNYSNEDGWRLLQVLKVTVAEAHPFSRFDVGNLKTLGSSDCMKTRDELISWNQRHYQAGAMKLAIVGKNSLEELESMAVENFGPVRAGSGQVQKYPILPWPAERLARVVSCVPLKQNRSVSACWPLPPQSEHLWAKPELYLSHVLGHEGEGSLHDVLNQRGWVESLSCGPSHTFSDSQLLSLNISLTPEGDANRDKVLALLFHYVDLVRKAGPQQKTFRELASLQEIEFAHKEESPAPDDFAAAAAASLHKYPAKEAIRGPFAVDDWRPDVLQAYMDTLTPQKAIVFITSSDFAGEVEDASLGWRCEKWYGAPFKEEPLDEEQLARWSRASEDSGTEELQLPEPNRFIPQDFSLRCAAVPGAALSSKLPLEVSPPVPLVVEPMLRLWHKTDCAFRTPREYFLAHIHTLGYSAGPEVVAMTRLFCSVIADDLNAFAYDAVCAGLGYGLSFSDNLSMSVSGFNDKLPDLMSVVLERVREVLEEAKTATAVLEQGGKLGERGQELLDKLETQRQILLQDYRNFTREEPWSIAGYYATQLMLKNSWHLDEYIVVLEKQPSLASFVRSVKTALKSVQIEVLAHGNVTAAEAIKSASTLKEAFEALGSEPLLELPRKKVTKLPLGRTTVLEYGLAAVNPAQENSCTENVYQVGPVGEDVRRDACLTLVAHVASTSAFQRLRTEQQLGYFVQAGVWAESHVAGFCAVVQGTRLPPSDIDARIEEWIALFEAELQKMPEEEFKNNILAVVSERTQRYAMLAQESGKHWSEILPRRYRFDSLPRLIEAMKGLQKSDVVDFFQEYLAQGAPSRRKLSLRVLGTSAGDARSESQEGGPVLRTLSDIRAFQDTCEMFEAPEPAKVVAVAA